MLQPLDIIYTVTYEGDDAQERRAIFDHADDARKFAAEHSFNSLADYRAIPVFPSYADYCEEYSNGVMTWAGR